jgi:hypothetical protein
LIKKALGDNPVVMAEAKHRPEAGETVTFSRKQNVPEVLKIILVSF